MDAAKKALSSHGKQLHANEMHIRRGANGGYIAKHHLTDHDGNPPTDGQRSETEYPLADHAALRAHVDEHMAPLENAQATMDADAGDK